MAAKDRAEERCEVASRLRALTGGRINWTGLQCAVFGGTALRSDTVDRLADLIDPGADTTMSAYDLLPEDDRAALDWVREHGGVEHVKEQGEALARRLSALAREAVADADPEDEAEALDVLERAVNCRLMPEGMEWLIEAWPRFEDGEPVRFLDNFERYWDENGVSVVTMYSDGSFALNFRAYSKGERVNRTVPKVLDADGTEIREGDTVWLADGRGPWKVARIVDADRLRVVCDDEENGHLNVFPESITHRAPLLAADGLPLLEGETVWHKMGHAHGTVESIDAGSLMHTVRYRGDDGSEYRDAAKDLTHERPDSWERLEDDAGKGACDYFGHGDDECCGCPASGKGCEETMARDLVRRARALAERGL